MRIFAAGSAEEFLHRLSTMNWLRTHQKPAFTIALLALTVWIGRYLHASEFGLYEDDLWRIPEAMEWSWSELWAELTTVATGFGMYQGRPLHFIFIRLFSWTGNAIGGLRGIYVIGQLILTLNAVLFYLLLRRVMRWEVLAVTGAFAYVLFPADTTQAFLTHSLGAHSGLTFLLAGSLLYFSKYRWCSYPVAVGALLSYETVFPVFAAIPLLERHWDKPFPRQAAVHVVIVLGLVGAMGAMRSGSGEGRIELLDPTEVAQTTALHLVIGPYHAIESYVRHGLKAVFNLRSGLWWSFLLASAVFFVLWSTLELPFGVRKKVTTRLRGKTGAKKQKRTDDTEGIREFRRSLIQISVAGTLMLALAYVLSFTLDASATFGRQTRVHLAAAPGAALLVGAFLSAVLQYAHRYRVGLAGVLAATLLFGALIPDGLMVQRDYAECWRLQRKHWTEIVNHLPDLESGTAVLVEPISSNKVWEMQVWSWATPLVLAQLYEFPEKWGVEPQAFRLPYNWRGQVPLMGGLHQVAVQKDLQRMFPEGRTVVFLKRGASLEREPNPVVIDGEAYPVKELPEPGQPPYPKRLLYRYLIGE